MIYLLMILYGLVWFWYYSILHNDLGKSVWESMLVSMFWPILLIVIMWSVKGNGLDRRED